MPSDTRGLDALAALCGSTAAVPTDSSGSAEPPRPASSSTQAMLPEVAHSTVYQGAQLQGQLHQLRPAPSTSSAYANSLYIQQVQQVQQQHAAAQQQAQAARAAQAAQQQAQHQAHQAAVAHQAASVASSLPPSVLQAYLAAMPGISHLSASGAPVAGGGGAQGPATAPGAVGGAPSPLAGYAGALGSFAPATASGGLTLHQHHHHAQQQNSSSSAVAQQHAQAQAMAQILAAQQQHHYQPQQAAGSSVASLAPAGLWAAAGLSGAPGSVISTAPQPAAQAVSTPPAPQIPVHIASPVRKAPVEPPSPSMMAMPPPQQAVLSPATATEPAPKPTITSYSVTLQPQTKPASDRAPAPSAAATTISSTSSVGNTIERPQLTPKTVISEWEDKKQLKRAANRLSAHLSRKRKKMFIEELKDENQELRRKEQILRSIPDLIVVFDSSGSMSFVSQSVTRFLDFESHELEDSSFWDRLSDDSVRMIKAAFMDALAVKRGPNEDSTPLSNGDSLAVRLIGRDGNRDEGKLVSLKGVVHFAGDSPECVCSIRPEDISRGASAKSSSNKVGKTDKVSNAASVQARRERALAAGIRSHQISDVDSEKS